MFPFNITNPGICIEGLLTSQEADLVSELAGLSYSAGDILYHDGNQFQNLAIGTEDQVLAVSAGGIPEWVTGGGGGGNFDDFVLDADSGTPETVEDGNTVTIAGGTGIDTAVSATDTVTINLDSGSIASLALADSSVQPGDNVSSLTNDAGYITATLTEEQVEDYVGGMLTGNTETGITVTYQDGDGTIDFVTDVTLTGAETLTNKTLTTPNINEAVALTATATELNILDGATLSTTELNYVDGVTSSIQTQLNGKQVSDVFLDDIAALTDPGADRILFWDDSVGDITWLTVGSGLSITDTTITATGGSGTITVGDGGTPVGSVDTIIFDGATVTDDTGGQVTVSIDATAGDSITDLNAMTTPVSTDVMVIVDDPGGTPETQKITMSNLSAYFANPVTDDGDSLGTTSLQWSDAFFASGGVVNFANGDLTLTHASGILTNAISNTSTTPQFSLTQASTGDAAMRFALGTTRSYAMGIDNSASDAFIISTAASGTAVLGTTNLVSLSTAGAMTLTAGLTATTISGTTITASTGFALGDTDYVGITSNERFVFNTAGTIVTTGADLQVTSANVGTNADSVPTLSSTSTFTNKTLTSPVLNTGVSGTALADASGVNTGTSTTTLVTPDALAGSYAGTKSVVLDVVEASTDVTTGDNKYSIVMPSSVNGMDLVAAHARVFTAGTTGTTDIQIHNVTDAVDVLSTKITIDSGETTSYTAATAPVINTSNDAVATGDIWRVDVDAVSTTEPLGLQVILEFRLP